MPLHSPHSPHVTARHCVVTYGHIVTFRDAPAHEYARQANDCTHSTRQYAHQYAHPYAHQNAHQANDCTSLRFVTRLLAVPDRVKVWVQLNVRKVGIASARGVKVEEKGGWPARRRMHVSQLRRPVNILERQ